METTTPILAHTPSLLLSYPGSGQTLFRLLIEVLSGRPTLSLYELAMQWQRIPMSVCFEGAGALRDVAHSGPPVIMVHHNSLYNRSSPANENPTPTEASPRTEQFLLPRLGLPC